LGITLEEFRRLPLPDGGDAKVICYNDPETRGAAFLELFVGGVEGEAGVFGCGFYVLKSRLGPLKGPPKWYDAGLKVATVKVSAVYFFVPDRVAARRLIRIEVRSKTESWDTFWEGFTGRYGEPKAVSRDPIQNKLGAVFDNTVAVWDNGESTIALAKRHIEIERLLIRLDHTGLQNLLRERIEQKRGRPKDNL
jgi:hypothetical protein